MSLAYDFAVAPWTIDDEGYELAEFMLDANADRPFVPRAANDNLYTGIVIHGSDGEILPVSWTARYLTSD